jgi:hypothetical protein
MVFNSLGQGIMHIKILDICKFSYHVLLSHPCFAFWLMFQCFLLIFCSQEPLLYELPSYRLSNSTACYCKLTIIGISGNTGLARGEEAFPKIWGESGISSQVTLPVFSGGFFIQLPDSEWDRFRWNYCIGSVSTALVRSQAVHFCCSAQLSCRLRCLIKSILLLYFASYPCT